MNRRELFKRVAILVPGLAIVRAIARGLPQRKTCWPKPTIGKHYDLLCFDDRCCIGLRDQSIPGWQIAPEWTMYCQSCEYRFNPASCVNFRKCWRGRKVGGFYQGKQWRRP